MFLLWSDDLTLWNNMSVAQFCTVVRCLVSLRFTFYVRHHIWDLYRFLNWLTDKTFSDCYYNLRIHQWEWARIVSVFYWPGNHGHLHTGDHTIGYDLLTFQELPLPPFVKIKTMSFWIYAWPTTWEVPVHIPKPPQDQVAGEVDCEQKMPMSF